MQVAQEGAAQATSPWPSQSPSLAWIQSSVSPRGQQLPGVVSKWAPAEDQYLAHLVAKHGQNWAAIAEEMPQRSPKRIRERYDNYIYPTLNNESPWTPDEDKLLRERCIAVGTVRWAEIAATMPGRSATSVQMHWLALVREEQESAAAAAQESAAGAAPSELAGPNGDSSGSGGAGAAAGAANRSAEAAPSSSVGGSGRNARTVPASRKTHPGKGAAAASAAAAAAAAAAAGGFPSDRGASSGGNDAAAAAAAPAAAGDNGALLGSGMVSAFTYPFAYLPVASLNGGAGMTPEQQQQQLQLQQQQMMGVAPSQMHFQAAMVLPGMLNPNNGGGGGGDLKLGAQGMMYPSASSSPHDEGAAQFQRGAAYNPGDGNACGGVGSGPRGQPKRWTQAESQRLRDLVASKGACNWPVLAKEFPGRTELQCQLHWQHVLCPQLIKGRGSWTTEEDNKLKELVNTHGRKWSRIAAYLHGRVGKQCRERYLNHLDPKLNKQRWTREEEQTLQDAHSQMGKRWADISKLLPGRSDNDCKNQWHALSRRQGGAGSGSGSGGGGGSSAGRTPRKKRKLNGGKAGKAGTRGSLGTEEEGGDMAAEEEHEYDAAAAAGSASGSVSEAELRENAASIAAAVAASSGGAPKQGEGGAGASDSAAAAVAAAVARGAIAAPEIRAANS